MQRPKQMTIHPAMKQALGYFQSGDLERAKKSLRKVLGKNANDVDANHLMGLIALKVQKFDIAIKYISKALSNNPDIAMAQNNLGEAYRGMKRYGEAEASYKRAIALEPRAAGFHNNLGVALYEQGKFDDALQCYDAALKLEPTNTMALTNLGNAQLGRGQSDEALASHRKAIGIDSNNFQAHLNLGNAYQELGRVDEAYESYAKAIALNPANPNGHANLGVVYQVQGRMDDAIASYNKALSLDPADIDAHLGLGRAFRALGSRKDAIAAFKSAISIDRNNTEAHLGLGNALRAAGDHNDAIASYEEAIRIDPAHGAAYHALSQGRQYTEYNEDIQVMEDLLARSNLTDEQRMHINYGLGKALEDIKHHGKAFDHILEANRLNRLTYDYDSYEFRAYLDRIIHVFSRKFIEEHTDFGYSDATPVFILGMPRSGTSLVEQILSSHSTVYGAGELYAFPRIEEKLAADAGDVGFPECLKQFSTSDFTDMGQEYIEQVRQFSSDESHITDKMPHNFLRVGLIHLALPNAKIIHCRRNPMDNCLSIFKNFFSAGHKYANDLGELGEYYSHYVSLMDHWRTVLPGVMFDLDYEKLVDDQEGETRKLLEYCGLEWEDACLQFHNNDRMVNTLSASQVRRPIYRDSVELWRVYENQVTSLREALSQQT